MENQTPTKKKRNLKPIIIALICILVLAAGGSAFAFTILPKLQSESNDTDDDTKKSGKEAKTDKEKLLMGLQNLGNDFYADFSAIDQYLGLSQLEQSMEENPVNSTTKLDITSINGVSYDANISYNVQMDAVNNVISLAVAGKYNDIYDGILGQVYVSPEKLGFASPLVSSDKVFSLKLDNIEEQLRSSAFASELDEEFYSTLEFLQQYLSNASTYMQISDEQVKKFFEEFKATYEDDWNAFCEALTVKAEGNIYTVTIPQKETLRILGEFISYTVNDEDISAYVKDMLKFVYESDEEYKNDYATFDEFYEGTYGIVQKSINLITGSIGQFWKNDIVFTVNMNSDYEIQALSYTKELTIEETTTKELTVEETTVLIDFNTDFETTDSQKNINTTLKATANGEEISANLAMTQTSASADTITSTLKLEMAMKPEEDPISFYGDCTLDKNANTLNMHAFVNGTNAQNSLLAITCDNGVLNDIDAGKSLNVSLPFAIAYNGTQVGEFALSHSTEITNSTPAFLQGTELDVLTLTKEEWNTIAQEASANINAWIPQDILNDSGDTLPIDNITE